MSMLSRPKTIRSIFDYTIVHDLDSSETASDLVRKIASATGWEELREFVEFEISETERLRDVIIKYLFTKCPKCGISFNTAGVEPRYIPMYNVLLRKCITCSYDLYYRCADGSEPTKQFRSEGLMLLDE